MKAIVNTAPGKLELQTLPTPEPKAGQVRIRTAACGICATDLEMIDDCPRSKFPQVLGHEWSGVVDACGKGADPALVGRRCVAENVLADGGEVGFEHPGGYGEYLITEAANVHVLPDTFHMDEAALIEPLAVGVRGVTRLAPSKRPAIIIGDGTIGLLMLMLLKRHGVEDITLVGGRELRLRIATALGASRIINYHSVRGTLTDELARTFAGKFGGLIEAAKSTDVMELAYRLGAPGAKILLIGNYYGKKAELLPQEFLHKEFTLMGSNASAGAWPEAVRLAAERTLPLAKLVTHRYAAKDFERGMQTTRTDKGVVKAVLCWDEGLLRRQ